MKENNINIVNGYHFSEVREESANDLLLSQSQNLEQATNNVLRMEVVAVDSYYDQEPKQLIAVYTLYVVAPYLGNFRRKILTVIEDAIDGSKFPVKIRCNIDDNLYEDISKDTFLNKISDIFQKNEVKKSIENLYQQSIEYKKDSVVALS